MNGKNLLDFPKQRFSMEPGRLLLAEPFMAEPHFKRAVVLITEHNAEGSFGLIINKPISMHFNDAMPDAPEFNAPLSLGGPVSKETLHFLHRRGDDIPGSKKIADNLFWGGDFDTVMDMMRTSTISKNEIRMFVGYAGWSKNQLKNELDMNSWIIGKSNYSLIFRKDTDDLWNHVLYKMGEPFRKMINFPEDPSLN